MTPLIPKSDFVSTHVYNDREDVGRFLEALDAVAGRAARASA
jgi:hypothetical protein